LRSEINCVGDVIQPLVPYQLKRAGGSQSNRGYRFSG
jgi:hypothetical protein